MMSSKIRKAIQVLFIFMLVAIWSHGVVIRFVGPILIVWCVLNRLYF